MSGPDASLGANPLSTEPCTGNVIIWAWVFRADTIAFFITVGATITSGLPSCTIAYKKYSVEYRSFLKGDGVLGVG